MSKQNKTNKTESQNTSNQTQNQDSKNCNQNGRTPVHGVLPFFMSVRPQGCTAL